MLIDTHCHLSFKAFSDDWRDVINRARSKGIQMITVGSQQKTSEEAITIANESDGVFASIGFHPSHADDDEFNYNWFLENANNPKVVAIGECGVEFFRTPEKEIKEILKKQEEILRKQISIAKQNDLPVILHARNSESESIDSSYYHLLRIIKDENYPKCVVHCYGGTWKEAKDFLDFGCMISFTGIVTFKNASEDLIETVKKIPNDKFMIETDAPYLSPEPHRGEENESLFVEYVAQGVAQIKNMPYDDIASITTKNAKDFFNI